MRENERDQTKIEGRVGISIRWDNEDRIKAFIFADDLGGCFADHFQSSLLPFGPPFLSFTSVISCAISLSLSIPLGYHGLRHCSISC